MILSRTPLRISLAGGSTDLPQFYRVHGGAVVSFCIDKYIHICVNNKFDGRTRVSYSITENVEKAEELKHDLARECLKLFQAEGVEITSVSDIPGEGTGLGSSSSFTVGLLAALSKKIGGKPYPCKMLAETGYTVESKLCQHPGVGKQDFYAAAYGGLHYYQFNQDETISVEPIFMSPENRQYLENHLLLLYTGITRQSGEILQDQEKNLASSRESIAAGCALRELAFNMAVDMQRGDFHSVGSYLYEGWKFKKRLSGGISNPALNKIHDDAIMAGANGGKLLGAGGGGFFLFFADPKLHEDIRIATGLRQVDFKMEEKGAEIIYDDSP